MNLRTIIQDKIQLHKARVKTLLKKFQENDSVIDISRQGGPNTLEKVRETFEGEECGILKESVRRSSSELKISRRIVYDILKEETFLCISCSYYNTS
jgi:hypothetical protein